MTEAPGPNRRLVRFEPFALDAQSGELWKAGVRVSLQDQPLKVLECLLERPGDVVSREDLRQRLWPGDTFVDFDHGVNAAVKRLREALGDSADTPRFIETLPRRGYRFVAPVQRDGPPANVGVPSEAAMAADADIRVALELAVERAPVGPATPRRWRAAVATIGVVLAALALGAVWQARNGRSTPPSPVSIAVLPFTNASNDADQEYLALGLTDETSASLAQIDPGRLIVKGRTGRYKGSTKTAAEIGQELGVDYLVEGTLRGESGRLRVTTTLIRVSDQEHVWTQSYEREVTSALALQQDVSAAIAAQIRARLSPDAAGVAVNRQTAVPEAYDAYLRGRFLHGRRTPEGNRQAIEAYRRAVTLDPNYALAWSSLSFTYAGSPLNADARPADVTSAARDAVTRALRANPELAEAQFVAGYVNWALDWDWPEAERRLRNAIALDPGAARAHQVLGHVLSQAGRAREAEVAMARASNLDPLDPLPHALWSQVAFQGRDAAAAIRHARQAILLDSMMWIGHMQLGQAYEHNGQADLALEALADATRLSRSNSKPVSLRGYVLARTGRTADAREILRLLEVRAKERYVPPYAFALVHAGLGDAASAFAWLDRAYAERDVHLIYLTVDAKWDPYRADPRFQALLVRCGFTAPSSAGR